MGACFNYRVYEDSQGRKAILEKWNLAVDDSLYNDGHSYSGGIGMLGAGIEAWNDADFKTRQEAFDWLEENQEKREQGKAVSFQEEGAKYWMLGGHCSS